MVGTEVGYGQWRLLAQTSATSARTWRKESGRTETRRSIPSTSKASLAPSIGPSSRTSLSGLQRVVTSEGLPQHAPKVRTCALAGAHELAANLVHRIESE